MTRGLLDPLAALESLSSWAQPPDSVGGGNDGAEGVEVAARSRLGRVLAGKWQLQALIGLGGMAAVYEARHRTGRRVAVKVMHGHLLGDRRLQKRFIREAYVVNSLEHPAIVPIHDADIDDTGAPFLVMELLEGQTIEALRVEHGGKLPASRVIEIAERVLDALAVAHERGIVHRDIKPANLFSTKLGELKVLDFGIATSREKSAGLGTETRSGSLLGTPAFVSPEQARGRVAEVNQQSDIWSLGATLFTLLSGETVHQAENANELWGQAMSASARSLRSVAPGAPLALISAVDGALRYDKKERWVSARAMHAALLESGSSSRRDAGTDTSYASAPRAATTASGTRATEHAAVNPPSAPRPRWRALLAPLALVPIGVAGAWSLGLPQPAPSVPETRVDESRPPSTIITLTPSSSPAPTVASFPLAVDPAQLASPGTNPTHAQDAARKPSPATGHAASRQRHGRSLDDAVSRESRPAAPQAAHAFSSFKAAPDATPSNEARSEDLLDIWN